MISVHALILRNKSISIKRFKLSIVFRDDSKYKTGAWILADIGDLGLKVRAEQILGKSVSNDVFSMSNDFHAIIKPLGFFAEIYVPKAIHFTFRLYNCHRLSTRSIEAHIQQKCLASCSQVAQASSPLMS